MAKSKTRGGVLLPLIVGIVCLIGAILLGSSAHSEEVAFQRPDYGGMQAQMLVPTVEIGQLQDNQQTRFCSGSLIWSDRDETSGAVTTLILTAKHCVNRVDEPMDVIAPKIGDDLRFLGEDSYRATVAGMCGNADLAYLRLEDTDTVMPTVALAGKDTQLFEIEDIWVVGYPKGLDRTVTQGQLGYLSAQPDYMGSSSFFDLIRGSASATGGNSGGPVFHQGADGSFEQIGVLVAGYRDAGWMTSMVGLEAMNKCVDDFLDREQRRLDRLAAEAGATK